MKSIDELRNLYRYGIKNLNHIDIMKLETIVDKIEAEHNELMASKKVTVEQGKKIIDFIGWVLNEDNDIYEDKLLKELQQSGLVEAEDENKKS